MQLRVIAKIKNDLLYQYRIKNNLTQDDMSMHLGLPKELYRKYENFLDYPKTYIRVKIFEEFFDMHIDSIFPYEFRKIIDSKIGRRFDKTYTLKELPEWNDTIGLLPSPEEEYIKKEINEQLKNKLKESLKTLTEREAKVLTKLFGLEGFGEHSLEEVGAIFKVSRSRIAQIRDKALRKLRYPNRSRKLKSFIDDADELIEKKIEKEKAMEEKRYESMGSKPIYDPLKERQKERERIKNAYNKYCDPKYNPFIKID